MLLSTSYLDEAERCDHVVVMHEGKVLAQGPPATSARLAAGRRLPRRSAAGKAKPRVDLQAELLDEPGVVDAVPEGGQVRFVRGATTACARADSRGVRSSSRSPPRFEDGFMVLLLNAATEQDALPGQR